MNTQLNRHITLSMHLLYALDYLCKLFMQECNLLMTSDEDGK
jgi:hypothetical protein